MRRMASPPQMPSWMWSRGLLLLLLSSPCFGFAPFHSPRRSSTFLSSLSKTVESCSLCVVGGGVSGLAAAYTAARHPATPTTTSILLLEACGTWGGRVRSDRTEDGFLLDRGFAVFLEEYPNAKALLDYKALDLHRWAPGALVKLDGRNGLARVANPLRQPQRWRAALTSPVGKISDKTRLLPLLIHVVSKSIDHFFQDEPETDTLTCLKERWKFSNAFIAEFLEPFLEGIFLAPLHQQSSRMFHFLFKMFTIGSVSLPRGGMQAVADQLATKCQESGVDIRTEHAVTSIRPLDSGEFQIQTSNGMEFRAKAVILATDVSVTQRLLSTLDGYQSIATNMAEPLQRKVGCLYYSFQGEPPVKEPILILNGSGQRGSRTSPIHNVCFPSVVCDSYAPPGYSLCSVALLAPILDEFQGQHDELDRAVRRQLGEWFPSHNPHEWKLQGMYEIPNAQPAQFGSDHPANVHEGRDCQMFRGQLLPEGLLLAGDHMATSSLNGALGSGMLAGRMAAQRMSKI